jgi:hypothetical protein
MSTDIKWGSLSFNDRSKHIISQQMQIFLWQYRAFILRIRVRFSDVNGPKGGLDKRCMVIAKLRSTGGEITIQSKGMDYFERFFNLVLKDLFALCNAKLQSNDRNPFELSGECSQNN